MLHLCYKMASLDRIAPAAANKEGANLTISEHGEGNYVARIGCKFVYAVKHERQCNICHDQWSC